MQVLSGPWPLMYVCRLYRIGRIDLRTSSDTLQPPFRRLLHRISIVISAFSERFYAQVDSLFVSQSVAMSSGDSPKRDGSPLQRTSKKRKVLSCYACRERKMKCDRVYPVCSRCQKTGRADSCTYDPRLQEDPLVNGDGHVDGGIARSTPQTIGENAFSSTHIPSESIPWKLRDQERRIENLERKLAAVDNPSNSDRPASEPRFREHTMFRGKGFKTQFYGSTSTWALISQVMTSVASATTSPKSTCTLAHNLQTVWRASKFHKRSVVFGYGNDGSNTQRIQGFQIPAKSLLQRERRHGNGY
jgi:hypothetical protein